MATHEVIAYQEASSPVKLTYDTWTPRPHFVIMQCTPRPDADDDELKATFEMIGRFLRQKPRLDSNAILCFRRGNWNKPETGTWQARLCVLKAPYLEEAKIAVKTENIPFWNKVWNWVTDIEKAMDAWFEGKKREGTEYKVKCTRNGIPDPGTTGHMHLATFYSNRSKFELVWTSPAPRIGIVARSPTDSILAELHQFICQVYRDIQNELRAREGPSTTFNCHLCLHVHGQAGTTVTCREGSVLSEDGRLTTAANLVGYIQISESQYLRWLPGAARGTWFDQFFEVEHFVGT